MIRAVKNADVIVIGAGAFGASTAYHLARRGARVALLDQHAVGSQTSPRAAGLTSKASSSLPVMARLRHEACEEPVDLKAACVGRYARKYTK